MKTIITTLILSASSLFALHPLSDYTQCQQPYIEKLRAGDASAFKDSIVKCKARLWNEDMQRYSSFNYKKLSETSLTCAGDIHSKEVLRGHKRSLRYAATFYRLSASKGNQDAKINLIYLKEEGSKVKFVDDTQKEYEKVFEENKNTKTFLQVLNGTKNIKREDRQTYMEKYKKQIGNYASECVISLQKDLEMLEKEKEDLNDNFAEMLATNEDKDFQESLHVWGNIQDRVLKSEINALKPVLRKFTGINKKMSQK